jgi:UDP-glucose 4-epimerase
MRGVVVPMKILVTGSQGFIGKHLCAKLRDLGHYVTEFDRKLGHDVLRLGDLRLAMPHCELVIHLAALNSATRNFYTQPLQVAEVGARGAMNVVTVALEEGVSVFILVSSSEVYGEPTADFIPTPEWAPLQIPNPANPRYSYAAGKIFAEVYAFAAASGFRTLQVLRPFNVYGPGQGLGHVIPDFLHQVKTQHSINILSPTNTTRAFCHVSDFISGLLAVYATGETDIYNVGNDVEVSIVELAKMLNPDGFVVVSFGSKSFAIGDPVRRCPDISNLRALGWEPKISLEWGLSDLLARARV